MISGIYLGVIFAKERSSQSFGDSLFLTLQHSRSILQGRKERTWGRKNEFVLWKMGWLRSCNGQEIQEWSEEKIKGKRQSWGSGQRSSSFPNPGPPQAQKTTWRSEVVVRGERAPLPPRLHGLLVPMRRGGPNVPDLWLFHFLRESINSCLCVK